MENMPGMDMTPPPSSSLNNTNQHQSHSHMTSPSTSMMSMTHMTFFWGKNAEILFSGWPGTRSGMYALALIFVFFLCLVLEWLNNCRWIRRESDNGLYGGVARTLLHVLRVGLGYLVMLALMSFNVGVLIVAILGHMLGYFVFGSRVFFKGGDEERIIKDNVGVVC